MNDVGRVCYKIAGRDAGKPCVVVKIIDKNFVLIDGEVRRKKCNIKHLEFVPIIINIRENAGHETVMKALVKHNVIKEVPKINKKPKKVVKPRPVKKKVVKAKPRPVKKKVVKVKPRPVKKKVVKVKPRPVKKKVVKVKSVKKTVRKKKSVGKKVVKKK